MTSSLAVDTGIRLRPDTARVITRLFVPGQELLAGSESRASKVVGRIVALDDSEVERALTSVMQRFGHRHRTLADTFRQNADRISNRIVDNVALSADRRQLLGATFTHEFSVEAAALCNPSMVPHPDQHGAPPGGLRFVMSVRGIGEGHRSSIGFRTGTITAGGTVGVDDVEPFPIVDTVTPGPFDRELFHIQLQELRANGENAASVLDPLGAQFTQSDLDLALDRLRSQRDTRRTAGDAIVHLRAISARSYTATFPPTTDVSERVLWPAIEAESAGMEDARFVRFVDDDGTDVYFATYTAFDGTAIAQQLLETTDFATFRTSPMVGAAAADKGVALFPRRIGGRFVALSRCDRETNAIAFSDNPRRWNQAETFQRPSETWETIQLGNCGSPIETDQGWLVLTHGVGPMRTYSIGALLLDLDDPTVIIGQLREPLLSPADDERDGYVPNVVYSCGALLHGDTLAIPYGIADSSIGIATVPIAELIGQLLEDRQPASVGGELPQ